MLKFLGGKFQMGIGEAHVSLALHRNQVNVSVGNLKAQYTLSNLHAGNRFLDSDGNLLCENLKASQFLVGKVKDVVNLALGDYQSVTLLQRADVEECKIFVVLGNLVARNLTSYNTYLPYYSNLMLTTSS